VSKYISAIFEMALAVVTVSVAIIPFILGMFAWQIWLGFKAGYNYMEFNAKLTTNETKG
jgi:hypothetical protein